MDILQAVFGVVGVARTPHATMSSVFTGQQVYSHISDHESMPWNLFLKHLDALASERVNCLQVVTPYENEFDVTGGMFKVNYAGVIETLVEETVAAFIDVGARR